MNSMGDRLMGLIARALLRALALTIGWSMIGAPVALESLAAEATSRAEGERIQLDDGWLFIPKRFKPSPEGVSMTLHLHGDRNLVERLFEAARQPGVLVNVSIPGLSSVYQRKFIAPATFQSVLRQTVDALREQGVKSGVIERLTVSSFSVGYGGVRELLKDPVAYERIDTLIMADSIYAGYVGNPRERRVNPDQMAGFLKFAKDAAMGKKRLLITHTDLVPGSYASTRETADFLIERLPGRRASVRETLGSELRMTSRFVEGDCEILGFTGTTGEDHMKHLRRLDLWYRRAAEN